MGLGTFEGYFRTGLWWSGVKVWSAEGVFYE